MKFRREVCCGWIRLGIRAGRLANLHHHHKGRPKDRASSSPRMAARRRLSISRCAGRQAAPISAWVCTRASSNVARRLSRSTSAGDRGGFLGAPRSATSSCCDSIALLSHPRAIDGVYDGRRQTADGQGQSGLGLHSTRSSRERRVARHSADGFQIPVDTFRAECRQLTADSSSVPTRCRLSPTRGRR